MIKLRVDVDYPYPSRTRSFLCVALRIKSKNGESYLRNARTIAKMVNDTNKDVQCYWFFSPYTIPDKKLLELLNPDRHEVALHVATKPFQEWKELEKQTGRPVKYFTIHGTQRIFTRLIWGRKLSEGQVAIPKDFPLKSFHEERTFSIDRIRFDQGLSITLSKAREWSQQDIVMAFHPEWLDKANKRGRRGPYYDLLRDLLEVDGDLCNLSVKEKALYKIGRDLYEYERKFQPTQRFLEKLRDHQIDLFSFLDRKWCCTIQNPDTNWVRENDNVALLQISTYDEWWQRIGKKTRNMVRKAEKSGVKIKVIEASDKLAEGIWKIYNETPIRQERAFSHFGMSLERVKKDMYEAKNNSFIGAYLGEELVGFIQILFGDQIVVLSNILSLQKHWNKALNNALLAKAVGVCAEKGHKWLMYGRMGNHPSLDRFKKNNGFKKFPITRYYIPITKRGKWIVKLGLHQDLKDAVPEAIKDPLIPFANWISRTKIRARLALNK